MEQGPHPFLKFSPASLEPAGDGSADVLAQPRDGRPALRLSAREAEVAALFDGQRTGSARLQMALDRELASIAQMQDLTEDLGLAGLLVRGRDEPIPAPRQVAVGDGNTSSRGFLPSSVPGSMAAAGYAGTSYASSPERGIPRRPNWYFRVPGQQLVGALFAVGSINRLASVLLLLLSAGGLFALWSMRNEASASLYTLLGFPRTLLVVIAAAYSINLVRQLARAAAITSATGQPCGFGIYLMGGLLPIFMADTTGTAEQVDAKARLRIVLSASMGNLLLFVLGLLGWLLLRHGGSLFAAWCLALGCVSFISFLLRINPLASSDGYHWLCQRLGGADIREQAYLAVFGSDRPWSSTPLPRGRLLWFQAAVIGYMIFVLLMIALFPAALLERIYGGVGVLIFLLLMLVTGWTQWRRARDLRKSLDPLKLRAPAISRRLQISLAVLAVLAILPYRYEPAGAALVLPADRVEVRALTAGEIRQVKVRDGEQVSQGQVLAVLSDEANVAAVAATEAQLKSVKAELAGLQAGGRVEEIEVAQGRVNTARTRYEFAKAEAERIAQAYRRKAATIQEYDRARGAAEIHAQELVEAERQLVLVKSPARDERIEALQAQVNRFETDLAYRQLELEHTRIRAPIAGTVASSSLMFARGQYLHVGDLLATVQDTGALQVEVLMPEIAAADLAVGARARLKAWAFPGKIYSGEVVSIAAYAEEGEYSKVLRLMVQLDPDQTGLKPEMTGQLKVVSRSYPAGYVYTRALGRFLLIEVWSWLP